MPTYFRVCQKWLCIRRENTICSFTEQTAKKEARSTRETQQQEKKITGGKINRTKYISKYLESLWALYHQRSLETAQQISATDYKVTSVIAIWARA